MDGFRDKVDAATRNLKDAKVKVKTEFDRKGDLVHDLDSAVADAGARAKSIEPKIKPKIDEANFQAQIRAVKAQAKLADAKMNISFDDTRAESKLEAEILKLKAIAKAQDIKLKISEDVGGGGRGGFGGFKMPDLLPNIAGLGGVPSLLLIVSALSLLAPALALVSTALVSLPALITAVAAPIGVLALGFGGIKKALEDSGILTDTKGKGGKDKIGLGTFIKGIQDSVSNVFEKGLTPLFRQLFDAFSGNIPILARGLPFIAQGLVDFATGVTRSLSSVPNLQMLDRLTNSIGTMMTKLTPGITSFTTAMIGLVTNVGDHLPGLGTVMSQWAGRFSNWVSEISKPKKDWFGGDIPNSSTLDSAVTNMKPILNSVIDFVGKLTDAGLKLAANPQMADNIKKVVDGLGNFVLQVLPGLEKFFGQIAGLMGKVQPPKTGPDGKPVPVNPKSPPPVDFDRVHSPSDSHVSNGWFGPSDGSLIPKIFRPDGLRDFLHNSLERPHTDHPVVVQQGGGGGQQQVQAPKVDTNGIAQSIQSGAGAIAAAANAAFKALSDAATVAVSQAVQAVQQLPGAIAQALSGVYQAALAAGQSIGTGMAAGIAASAPSAIAAATALANGVENATKGALGIHSPSKVFQGIGQNTAQGFQDGLEGGFQGVLDSANGLSKQLTDAMQSGTRGAGSQFGAQIKDQLQAIKVEQDQLRAQSDGTADKGQKKAIQGQMDQLNIAKDQLKTQATQLGYSEKHGSKQEFGTDYQEEQLRIQQDQLKSQYDATKDPAKRREIKQQMDLLKQQQDQLRFNKDKNIGAGDTPSNNHWLQSVGNSTKSAIDIGKGFAMANVNQFENDIGISGKGAIPTIANIGLDWATSTLSNMASGLIGGNGKGGSQTHIHVNSIDEGLAAKQTLENRQALTNSAGR